MSDQKKFRITLWEINTTAGTTGGWRGTQKAVVLDASGIGVEEYANDSGSAFWTLQNSHPQIAEFVPLQRHYEISRWSTVRGRWEFVGAGILNDYSAGEYETTFSGIDYKSVLNKSFTPLATMTVSDASALNSRLTADYISPSEQPFSPSSSTAYLNSTALSVGALKVTTFSGYNNQVGSAPEGTYINDPDGTTTYWETPVVKLDYSVQWNGAAVSTGFSPEIWFRLYAAPSATRDSGTPPLPSTGLIGEWSGDTFTTTLTSGRSFSTEASFAESVYLATKEIETTVISAGYNFTGYANVNDVPTMVSNFANPLRTGVTYTFQLYAAIKRTSTGVWYRSSVGAISTQVTIGQQDTNASKLISNIFNNTITSESYSRLRYSSLSISGSTATTHKVYSNGEPVLDHIASIAELEMGAKTNGDKVVFGIVRPSGGSSYAGTFNLNLSVSSAASTALHLRYPDNVKSFNYDPGFSRVVNDITLVPSTPFLSGTSGQQPSGVTTIGAQVSNTATIATYGRIKSVVQRSGLVDASAASNEARRLLTVSDPANTKQVGLAVTIDAVDLWNGWDVGDSIRVTIKQGLADINEAFVISGVRWFGEGDGHERVELELVQASAFGAQYAVPSGAVTATRLGR